MMSGTMLLTHIGSRPSDRSGSLVGQREAGDAQQDQSEPEQRGELPDGVAAGSGLRVEAPARCGAQHPHRRDRRRCAKPVLSHRSAERDGAITQRACRS